MTIDLRHLLSNIQFRFIIYDTEILINIAIKEYEIVIELTIKLTVKI